MWIVIGNPKGGVGKTTFALNVAIPFMHLKGIEPINYYEIDIANREAEELEKLGILNLELKNINPEVEREYYIPENTIVDLGANESFYKGFKYILKSNLVLEDKVVFVIPMKTDISSSQLAFDTYLKIKKHTPWKVVFAFSEVRFKEHYTKEFPAWFGEPAFDFSGYEKELKETDRNYFVVPYNTEVNTIRTIGSYIPYEFYLKHKNTIIEEYRNAKTEKEKQKVISRKALLQGIEEFLEETKPYYSILEV
jgi:hypothetical protein